MKALVTGGAGFIGSHVVRELLGRDGEVVILDNLTSGYRENLAPEARFIEGDVREAAAVRHAMEGCDVAFHLAASVGNTRSIDNPIADATINHLGTLNMLEAARAAGVRRIVYSSSAGIFGEPVALPLDESHPVNPVSPYGVSKLAGEKACLAYNALYGMWNVCLRYFNVFGPRQRFDPYGNVIPIFAARIFAGEPLKIYGDGEQTRDFVRVQDVARANVMAGFARDGVSGAFNIGGGRAVTVNYLAREILKAAGRTVPIVHGAERPGDVRDSLAAIGAACQAFEWAPAATFEDGLAEYVQWYGSEMV